MAPFVFLSTPAVAGIVASGSCAHSSIYAPPARLSGQRGIRRHRRPSAPKYRIAHATCKGKDRAKAARPTVNSTSFSISRLTIPANVSSCSSTFRAAGPALACSGWTGKQGSAYSMATSISSDALTAGCPRRNGTERAPSSCSARLASRTSCRSTSFRKMSSRRPPTAHDVVNAARILDSQLAWHEDMLTHWSQLVNSKL